MKLGWLLVLTLAACGEPGGPPPASPVAPATPVAVVAPVAEPWVPIATYMNPELSKDQTQAIISALLKARRIEWVAVGSLGYTLSVPASRADEVRAVLRGDARLSATVNVL